MLVWSIAKKVAPYSNVSKNCLKNRDEKFEIINYHQPDKLLNKSSESIFTCRYANKFLLRNSKINH